MLLIDFSDPRESTRWSPIDDSVMGGRSNSQLRFEPAGHAVFSGEVSFDNGGGFASIRRQPADLGAAGVVAWVLDVRGDGKRYKLSVRSDDSFDGINYQCSFCPPAGRWSSCRLACSEFLPTWRGRIVPDQPPLDPASLRQLGLMIADRQGGPFALAIRSIGCELAASGV